MPDVNTTAVLLGAIGGFSGLAALVAAVWQTLRSASNVRVNALEGIVATLKDDYKRMTEENIRLRKRLDELEADLKDTREKLERERRRSRKMERKIQKLVQQMRNHDVPLPPGVDDVDLSP